MRYETTQYGWFLIVIFLAIIVFLFLAYFNQWGTNPIPNAPFLIMTGVFVIPLVLFYKLKIIIKERSIRIIYGIGLVRKIFSPERIVSVENLKIPWYSGMGIRITAHGWLYSVEGFRVVKIIFRKDGAEKTVLIGTPEPEQLKTALENHFS